MTPTTLQAADDTLKQLEAVTPLDVSTTLNGGEAQGQGQGQGAAAAAAATDAVTEGLAMSVGDPQKTSQTASELQESNPDNHATVSGNDKHAIYGIHNVHLKGSMWFMTSWRHVLLEGSFGC
jgi:hypothetical protein